MTDEDKTKHLKDTKWKPGQSGNPDGRPKETFNRPNLLKLSRDMKIHPEEVLLHFVAGNHEALKLGKNAITANMRLKAAIEALKKMVPDLKAVEHNVNTDPESEGNVRSVVILPNNDRSAITADDAAIVPIDQLRDGVDQAIAQADDTE